MDICKPEFESISGAEEFASNRVSLILKVVDYCNFECPFCRYAHNTIRSSSKMDISVAIEAVKKAVEYNLNQESKSLHVMFHGGEPLLWGIDNFQAVLDMQNELAKLNPGIEFENSIQTNGELLNDAYIKLLSKYNFSVGFSVDGPDFINFHKNELDRTKTILKLLNESGLRYGILSVITNSHIGHAEDYYRFLVDNGIRKVGLCYCFDPSGKESVDPVALSEFLVELFDLYFFNSYSLRIREFDAAMRLSLGYCVGNCNHRARQSCGNYYSILPDGRVALCDPYDQDQKTLGNIKECDFLDIKSSRMLELSILQNRVVYDSCCRSCLVKKICKGGCPRNDVCIDKNYFCETYIRLYSHIGDIVERYKKGVDDERN